MWKAALDSTNEKLVVTGARSDRAYLFTIDTGTGAKIWERFSHGGISSGQDISVDGKGNVYVTGAFKQSFGFEPATWHSPATDDWVGFVSRLGVNDGRVRWTQTVPSTETSILIRVATVPTSKNVNALGFHKGKVTISSDLTIGSTDDIDFTPFAFQIHQ
ncbi:MAG: hypothetical protein IPJ88_11955 [Myxococcales bacterium]|nr:MAG: hypothetical protein IPJ88_11955 [Myxococcales bacterium]